MMPVIPAVIAVLSALLLILLDFSTRVELNIAVLYSVPLVFAAGSRRPRVLWTLATTLVSATFLVYRIQAPPHLAPLSGWLSGADPYLADRALAGLTILLTAAILQGWLTSLRAVEHRDAAIAERNERLAQANQTLTRQREEIVRQNAELERRRREVEAISSKKTQMLASISHDIRTPIQSISLMAEVIKRAARSPAADARVSTFAERLQSHALSVGEMLSEVIDLASFDAGEIAIHPSVFELAGFLREQVQRLAPLAEAKGLELVLETPPPIVLCTDKAKLARVVGNLVSNAVKFTQEGTVIIAATQAAEGGVCIQVKDTGCGIRPENLQRIFGDFCQEDGATDHSSAGWGLGLSICRRLTSLLGGELRVESAPGVGSAFTVALPANARAHERRYAGEHRD